MQRKKKYFMRKLFSFANSIRILSNGVGCLKIYHCFSEDMKVDVSKDLLLKTEYEVQNSQTRCAKSQMEQKITQYACTFVIVHLFSFIFLCRAKSILPHPVDVENIEYRKRTSDIFLCYKIIVFSS